MSGESDIADIFEGNLPLFEQKGRPNGFTTWSARAFAKFLGYKDFGSFKNALNKAQQVLMTMEIDIAEHFKQEKVIDAETGEGVVDTRMSRFACYLVAMNGDTKKKQVARAQAYFARYNEECQRFMDDTEQIERILIRDELSDHEKTLSRTASKAGVEDFARFQNAGYRGLYNMNLSELKELKSVPKNRSPLDFMGKDELAANLFRITQTDAKIRSDGVNGQRQLEGTAQKVGKTVRETMHKISGQRPENLPGREDIRKLKQGIKGASSIIKEMPAAEVHYLPEPAAPEYPESPYEADTE